jgi:hypothetical protein
MATQQDFINQLYPLAIENYKKYGILPSITIGQAALESGYGDSKLAKNAYNLFGIKGVGTAGSVEMNTQEEINGKKVSVMDYFRKYFSIEESVNDYGRLLSTDRYKPVKNAADYKTAAYALQSAGYATDSSYPTSLISVINENQLYKIDQQVKSGNTSSNSIPITNLLQTAKNTETHSATTEYSFGGALNPSNWFTFIENILYKAAFFVPALILIALGIYFLFSEQINEAVKGYATGGASLVAKAAKGGN